MHCLGAELYLDKKIRNGYGRVSACRGELLRRCGAVLVAAGCDQPLLLILYLRQGRVDHCGPSALYCTDRHLTCSSVKSDELNALSLIPPVHVVSSISR
jgi:hypothetical protein